MPNIKVFNQTGEAVGSMKLADEVFGQEYTESRGALVHQVVVAQLANARQGTKSTLTRTEVRGGGKKPWRQKHTGKARQGSIRAPQWNKGGVVFAPKPRDFSQKVNKNAKRTALCVALSKKLADKEIIVIDDINVEGKTKEMVTVLSALKLDKSVLLVLDGNKDMVVRAAKNIPALKTTAGELINVYDVVAYNKVVMTKSAIKKIEEAYKA